MIGRQVPPSVSACQVTPFAGCHSSCGGGGGGGVLPVVAHGSFWGADTADAFPLGGAFLILMMRFDEQKVFTLT